MDMLCRQCEQTARGTGCTVKGVCGKTPETAGLQDLLIYSLKGIAYYGWRAAELGVRESSVERFVIESLFTTITNVNFDQQVIAELIYASVSMREKIRDSFLSAYKAKYGCPCTDALSQSALYMPEKTIAGLLAQAYAVRQEALSEVDSDTTSLREILLFGLKGMAAYADHAALLGREDTGVNLFFYKGLMALADKNFTSERLVNLIMDFGLQNLRCMEILDDGHTGTFGHPVPTKVIVGVRKGPAIIVSGHDLNDLQQLLEQTKNKGINIYTHGEMLPAHGYPVLKDYSHLVGHFGTAWQNQQREFDNLPAVILMTTNCIQEPRTSYQDRIFTTGLVRWPGVRHISAQNGKKDFTPVIEKALALGGFSAEKQDAQTMVGFSRNAVLNVASKVIELVQTKKIRHFFLVGGCDGAKPGRNYYTELVKKIPSDCLILTLACGKFRFNTIDFGTIEGLPRLLDCGQCNDAYSAIQIALALAKAFRCDVNSLPLSLILSWYEQKAVCILLTLLALGVKNIRIGPSLPAFISPNILTVLVEKFGLKPISTPEEDLRSILG